MNNQPLVITLSTIALAICIGSLWNQSHLSQPVPPKPFEQYLQDVKNEAKINWGSSELTVIKASEWTIRSTYQPILTRSNEYWIIKFKE